MGVTEYIEGRVVKDGEAVVEARQCSSEKHDGLEITFKPVEEHGYWIDLRALIEAVQELDGYAIEECSVFNDGDSVCTVFLAEVSETMYDDAFIER